MFGHERGHSEEHNPVDSFERVQAGIDSDRRRENRIQSKRHWHPLSDIRSRKGDVLDNVHILMIVL